MARIPTILEAQDGSGAVWGVNPRRLQEIPYFLLPNAPDEAVTVPANGTSQIQVGSINGDGPGQVMALGHQKTNDVLVLLQMQSGSEITGLMNGAVHIDTIFGSGRQPYYLPEALFLNEMNSLQMSFTDISGAGSTVRPCFLNGQLLTQYADPSLNLVRDRMEGRQHLSTPYFYTFDAGRVTVGAGATVQRTITVGQTDHFDIMQLSRVSTGRFNINIVDVARGESIISAPQDVNYAIGDEILFGNGNFPFKLHEPRMIQVRQKLLVTLTDRSGAPNTIDLTLGGRAIKLQTWR